MSTATLDAPAAATGRDTRPPFHRLVRVELRKMTDTRAGFWLTLSVAAITLLVVVLMLLLADDGDRDLLSVLQATIQPASILLPVIGILLITSEWSQRTHLATFALVPDRMRVVAAKLGAALAAAVGATLVVLAVTAAGVALAGETVNGDAAIFGQLLVYLVASVLIGIAFGTVLLSSAPAIVLYFVLPTVFAALSGVIDGDVFEWLDTTLTFEPLVENGLDGTQWAQVGTSLLLWLAAPLAAGLLRIRRSEIN